MNNNIMNNNMINNTNENNNFIGLLGQMYGNPQFLDFVRKMYQNPEMIKLSLNMMGINNEQYESSPFMKEIYNPEMFNIMLNPQNAAFYNQIFNNIQNNNKNENEKKGYENNENLKNKNEIVNDMMEKLDNLYYKEKYKEKLEKLKEMGFNNEQLVLKVLQNCNGNVDDALGLLLNDK